MATTKISVTVDQDVLAKLKAFLPADFNLSGLLNDALREQLARHEMIAVLEKMNVEDPPSEADEMAGEALWQAIRSSSTQAQSPRSRPKKSSASRRSKR